MSQFYNATDKELSIYHDTLALIGIDESDTTTYPVDGTYTRDFNKAVNKYAYRAWRNAGDWEFDDSNIAGSDTDGLWTYGTTVGLPKATRNLTSNLQDVPLPTDALEIQRVEIKDENSDWSVLHPIDESQIGVAVDEYEETAGRPRNYDLIGTNLRLFPKVDTTKVTATAGLKITLARAVDQATPADTSQVPPFPEVFQPLISMDCAIRFCVGKEMWEKVNYIKSERDELEKQFDYYYKNRNRAFQQKSPRRKRFNQF